MNLQRIAQNIALTFAGTALPIVFLEILLRTTHLFGARVSRFKARLKEQTITMGGDWTAEKQPGVTRVAVAGDSLVEALLVEAESTFMRIVKRGLKPINRR